MILKCPLCATTHTRPDAEVAGGQTIVCRRCGEEFSGTVEGRNPAARILEQTQPMIRSSMDGSEPSEPSDADRRAPMFDGPTAVMEQPRVSMPPPPPPDADDDDDPGPEEADGQPNRMLNGEEDDYEQGEDGREESAHEARTAVMTALGQPEQLGVMEEDTETDGVVAQGSSPWEDSFPLAADPDTQPNHTVDDVDSVEDLGFDDVPTDIIHADALRATLEKMRATADVDKQPVEAGNRPTLDGPKTTGADELADPGAIPGLNASSLPEPGATAAPAAPKSLLLRLAVKPFLFGVGASAVFIAIVSVILWAALGGTRVGYLKSGQALLASPLDRDETAHLAELERGSRLVIYDETAGYAAVRDNMGRVGYVPSEAIVDPALPSSPKYAFADCERAPTEKGPQPCLERGRRQYGSCRNVCEPLPDKQGCLDQCQTRFDDCDASCVGRQEPPAIVDRSPAGEGGTGGAGEASSGEPEDGQAGKVVEPGGAKKQFKPARKKKKRGRKKQAPGAAKEAEPDR